MKRTKKIQKKAAKLEMRYELFAKEYVIDLNGARSAIAAGYAVSGAKEQASLLLTKPNIRALIDKELSRRATRLEIKADRVIEELARMGFANMDDYISTTPAGDAYVNLGQLSRDQAAAIQEITVEEYTEGRGEDKRDIKRTKFKLHDKRGALELLGRNLKLFTDKVETSGAALNVNIDSSDRLTELLTRAAGRSTQVPHAGRARRSDGTD